jgi:DNA-binding MarR family transcriptional regulator
MTIKRNISVESKKDFGFREFTFWVVRHQQAIADRLGIHITDLKCLGVLHRKGAMTPKTLATEMAVSTAAMTTIIDRLERVGYVQRKRESHDRRSLTVHATAQSRKRVTRLYKSLEDQRDGLNAGFTQEALKVIFRYLRQATVALQTATATLADDTNPKP